LAGQKRFQLQTRVTRVNRTAMEKRGERNIASIDYDVYYILCAFQRGRGFYTWLPPIHKIGLIWFFC